jgi:hypothetical protein
MSEDPRCCGSGNGTCIIDTEGRCWCGSFQSDEALIKLFYLAQQNISRKWTVPIRDWKAALNRFTIQFGDRMPQH